MADLPDHPDGIEEMQLSDDEMIIDDPDEELPDNENSYSDAQVSEPDVGDGIDDIPLDPPSEDEIIGNIDDEVDAEVVINDDDDQEWEDPLPRQNPHNLDARFFVLQRGNAQINEHNGDYRGDFAVALAQNLVNRETYKSLMQRTRYLRLKYHNPWIPTTMEALWNRIGRNAEHLHYRLYCEECLDLVGETSTPTDECGCGKCGPGRSRQPLAIYIHVSITAQLTNLLQKPGMANALRYRFTRTKIEENSIEDIYDGDAYQELTQEGRFLHVPEPDNVDNNIKLSFTLWVDHVELAKSSKAKACIILLQLNELSPRARKRHIILAGVWTGKIKAPAHTILEHVATELRTLYDDGIVWRPSADVQAGSRFAVLIFCADSEDRYPVLRMMRHNARVGGCTFCDMPTHVIRFPNNQNEGERRRRAKRYYPSGIGEIRTDDGIRANMIEATETGRAVNGAVGISPLYFLPEFRFDRGPIVESFHNVYEGVTKKYIDLIMTNNDIQWFINGTRPANLALLNAKLETVKLPSRVSRRPRKIETYEMWKGTEFRNFLFYLAVPSFNGILRQTYINHWAQFAESIFILDSGSFTRQQLDRAERRQSYDVV